MCFKYIKNLLFIILIVIILFNYLDIKLFNIRENYNTKPVKDYNTKPVKVTCEEKYKDNINLCLLNASVENQSESFNN